MRSQRHRQNGAAFLGQKFDRRAAAAARAVVAVHHDRNRADRHVPETARRRAFRRRRSSASGRCERLRRAERCFRMLRIAAVRQRPGDRER